MEDKKKIHKRVLITAMVLLMSVTASVPACAADGTLEGGKELVFLLDASESMNANDPERHAIDSIAQFLYSLPADYKAGLVAYGTEVCARQELLENSQRDRLVKAAGEIQYAGYSNAGAGLSAAVDMFSDHEDTEKYIIMLSDGEIDMPEDSQAEASRLSYVEAANRGKEKGIKIYITAIGAEMDLQMHIFDGAELTEGAVYWENQAGSLSQLMEKIATERLMIPRQDIGVTDAGGGSIHAKLPGNAGHIKVILTSDTALEDVSADYSAAEGRVITGENFAVVDMERPDSEYADVHFKTEDISGIKAYMLVEYSAKPKMDVAYNVNYIYSTKQCYKDPDNLIPEWKGGFDSKADLTFGIGHSIKTAEEFWKIKTRIEQCEDETARDNLVEEYYLNDISRIVKNMNEFCFPDLKDKDECILLTQNQFDAVISFQFQMEKPLVEEGNEDDNNFCSFLREHRGQEYPIFTQEQIKVGFKYTLSGGVRYESLLIRRNNEIRLFCEGEHCYDDDKQWFEGDARYIQEDE